VFATYTAIVRRANLPIPAVEQDACTVQITSLKGSGLKSMDQNGLSDPYIVFHAPWLDETPKTSIIKKTLDPEWPDNDVPVLKPNTTNSRYLESALLYLQLMDHDALNR